MEDKFSQQFQVESVDQLSSLRTTDIQEFHNEPIPENMTIVGEPDTQSVNQIQTLVNELRVIEPDQYFYPTERLHLTLLGNISIHIDPFKVQSAIEQTVIKYPLEFRLQGLGSNRYCSSLSAYPINFSIHELRDELRVIIGDKGDDYKSVLQSYEYMGWINYMRYLKMPSQAFLDKLLLHKDTLFGQMKLKSVRLFKTKSKVLDPKATTLLKEFNIQ